jgi:AICAR transformylase/IMP cyclohydrolase PurH
VVRYMSSNFANNQTTATVIVPREDDGFVIAAQRALSPKHMPVRTLIIGNRSISSIISDTNGIILFNTDVTSNCNRSQLLEIRDAIVEKAKNDQVVIVGEKLLQNFTRKKRVDTSTDYTYFSIGELYKKITELGDDVVDAAHHTDEGAFAALNEVLAQHVSVEGQLHLNLRYGENPHQNPAGLYKFAGEARFGVISAKQIQGKQLSYNNINDTDAAFELVSEFNPACTAAVAIIKHANPCGVAEGSTLVEAYDAALRCDPVSAFGGIVALNRKLDEAAARKIVKSFTEVIIAPDADPEAKAIVATKKNLRLLLTGGLSDPRQTGWVMRPVSGGFLWQPRDNLVIDDMVLEVVTKIEPTEDQWADLRFAFRVAKHVKSNAIVYAKGGATVGIGAGQMSRVDSSRIAAWKAAEAAKLARLPESLAKGSVVASDAFFPFADGLLAAAEAGATAVIQPGGSMRDDEVIKAANEAGLAMVFTGHRHFRH